MQSSKSGSHEFVLKSPTKTTPAGLDNPQQYLLSDSDGEEPVVRVDEVRVQDKGS